MYLCTNSENKFCQILDIFRVSGLRYTKNCVFAIGVPKTMLKVFTLENWSPNLYKVENLVKI